MLDEYLKIFGLDNNYSLDELEERYKKLLKEFDTKNIEYDLKVIFLEEQGKIKDAYQILLKHYHKQEKVDQIKSVKIQEKSIKKYKFLINLNLKTFFWTYPIPGIVYILIPYFLPMENLLHI